MVLLAMHIENESSFVLGSQSTSELSRWCCIHQIFSEDELCVANSDCEALDLLHYYNP